jgi:hypothetical protein
MIPWGDVGVSVIFFSGLFAILRRPKNVQRIAVMISGQEQETAAGNEVRSRSDRTE